MYNGTWYKPEYNSEKKLKNQNPKVTLFYNLCTLDSLYLRTFSVIVLRTFSGCWHFQFLFSNKKGEVGGFTFLFVVYYESLKRELQTKPIYEFRCDERLQTKIEEFTRLAFLRLFICNWIKISSSRHFFLFFFKREENVKKTHWTRHLDDNAEDLFILLQMLQQLCSLSLSFVILLTLVLFRGNCSFLKTENLKKNNCSSCIKLLRKHVRKDIRAHRKRWHAQSTQRACRQTPSRRTLSTPTPSIGRNNKFHPCSLSKKRKHLRVIRIVSTISHCPC